MWWARSETPWVYLSGRMLATGGRGVPPQRIDRGPAPDGIRLLGQWVQAHPKRRWRVALGGTLCTLHLVEPVAGVQSIEEAESAASALLSESGLPVQARLARWSARAETPWVVACMPAGLPDELSELVGERRLAALAPWWLLAAGPRPLPREAAMCDDEAVTYWRTDAAGGVLSGGSLAAAPSAQQPVLQRLQVAQRLDVWHLDATALHEGRLAAQEEGRHADPRPAV